MSGREIALMVPIVVLMFWIGIYPSTFLRKMDAASAHLLEHMRTKSVLAECGGRATDCRPPNLAIPVRHPRHSALGERSP